MNDLYARVWMEDQEPQESDIHWRYACGEGGGMPLPALPLAVRGKPVLCLDFSGASLQYRWSLPPSLRVEATCPLGLLSLGGLQCWRGAMSDCYEQMCPPTL